MSGLENLKTRLEYRGGNAESRFIKDKLHGLKKSLLYSYQAATIILEDGREFRCLINPNKETGDYDNKILSIPYKDICLNSSSIGKTTEGEEEIGLKCGDVITWKETNTKWIIFLQYLEEDAYFRAQIRKCEQSFVLNDKLYWVYIRGPVETSVNWNQKGGIEWNDLNFSLVMFITKDDNTYNSLKRFSKIRMSDAQRDTLKTWQVVGVNPNYGDGVMQVYLDEYFENSIELEREEEKSKEEFEDTNNSPSGDPFIKGNKVVKGYSTVSYSIENASGGTWLVISDGRELNMGNNSSISLDINKRSGSFVIEYRENNSVIASLNVSIIGF